ncbi:exopolysaccharide gene cluster protein [Indibacter alkaliphilus LW1]|uniref:Peptide O-xylosyltransferase n=1 Tax=Indibacter alkaliphilus (strain CCUG 57479 / KCTC 22604 / LW1) TaxID=1189612 RepID=S2DAY9_INDAL|nr:glycosyl transferase [Indibacter alkaliphilus]EOZ96377.1 exopolysaccharide gene cluster protein [Indibacter alkaliphilus LW1]
MTNYSEKHAILFISHKNLERIFDYFKIYDDRFYYFIHIDTKSKFDKSRLDKIKSSNKNVVYIGSEVKVNWGGYNYLEAMFLLIKKALAYTNFDYIHTTSEANLPIKTCEEFIGFFNENKGKLFLENFPVPSGKWMNGGLDRFNLYSPHDLLNAKTRFGNFLINKITYIQKLFGVNRNINKTIEQLYGGSCWFSLTQECLKFCMEFIETNPEFLKAFKNTHCPEEAFFQTLIMNSKFKNQVVNDHLNYIDWEFRNGNSPANLDLSDLDKVLKSSSLTARKIVPGVSDSLRLEIMRNLKISK